MVVAPHRTFAIRNLLAGRNIIPAIWAVINRMQQKALVPRVGRKIGLIEQAFGNRKCSLLITLRASNLAEAPEALSSDCSSRTVHGLPVVEGIRRPIQVIAELVQVRSAG